MKRHTAYISGRRAALRLNRRLTGVAVLAAACCVAVLALVLAPDQVLAVRSVAANSTVPVLPASVASPSRSSPAPESTMARRVYRYSIIPGGVSGRDELARVIKTDKVVAAHYASFDVDKAVKVTVAKPRAVHVSYRKGDKVYWTAKKLMLAEGETLLSDGSTELRARCANRISDVPQFPVEVQEPTEEEMDSLVGLAMDAGELGFENAAFTADGFSNGLGLGLASGEPQSGSKEAAASRGSIIGNPATWTRGEPESGRTSIGRFDPGNPASGTTGGTPVVVTPPQSQAGGQGNTPGPTAPPGSTPSTPDVPPPPPGDIPPPAGVPDTHPVPPLTPEPPEWPPGHVPEVPGENVHEVPEPGTLWLCAAAFAGMLLLRRNGARAKR